MHTHAYTHTETHACADVCARTHAQTHHRSVMVRVQYLNSLPTDFLLVVCQICTHLPNVNMYYYIALDCSDQCQHKIKVALVLQKLDTNTLTHRMT